MLREKARDRRRWISAAGDVSPAIGLQRMRCSAAASPSLFELLLPHAYDSGVHVVICD